MTNAELTVGLRGYTRRRPFRPFVIEFVSGAQVEVNHPDGVASFGRLFLFRGRGSSRSVFAASSVCRLLDPVPPNVA